mmetsp:Transcript_20539/g.63861  ORF Transcript_20539/g.63861 Transcript_20539/m.63861 type:complete len:208 (-) Transcript_20539:362-985(-)
MSEKRSSRSAMWRGCTRSASGRPASHPAHDCRSAAGPSPRSTGGGWGEEREHATMSYGKRQRQPSKRLHGQASGGGSAESAITTPQSRRCGYTKAGSAQLRAGSGSSSSRALSSESGMVPLARPSSTALILPLIGSKKASLLIGERRSRDSQCSADERPVAGHGAPRQPPFCGAPRPPIAGGAQWSTSRCITLARTSSRASQLPAAL